MDENLQDPLKKLAEALHRAIEESADVETALANLRASGFSAVLLLEVTVALSRETDDGDTAPGLQRATEWTVELPAPQPASAEESPEDAPVVMQPSDTEFLRALRIRLD